MSNYILLHNGDFANSDELYHWKYIKKVRGYNGKWKYYYDIDQLKDDLGFDEKKDYERARLIENMRSADESRARANFVSKTRKQNLINGVLNGLLGTNITTKGYESSRRTLRKAQSASYIAKRNADAYLQKYYSTPIGRIAKVADSGKKFLSGLFSKNDTPIWSGTDAARRRHTN